MTSSTLRSDDLNDSLDDLIGSPTRTPKVLPEGFKPIEDRITEPCPKCSGTGRWRGGMTSGSCFKCNGTGRLTFKTRAEDRARNRQQVATRKVRKGEAALEAFKAGHPDVWAWMDGSTFGFAISMRDAIVKYGDLTENQMAACRRCIEKLAAAKGEATKRVEEAKSIDMTKIEAAFARAGSVLKRPTLRLSGFTIYPAKADSRNAGFLYVRGLSAVTGENLADPDAGESLYLGKIGGGKFIRSRECSAEQEAALIEVAADPQAAAVKYGRLTGACACCGRHLENQESVARGIGPICAQKFGW